ncbi:hypothetical protein PMIN04_005503 [Paraphaeosphaeria minitans]
MDLLLHGYVVLMCYFGSRFWFGQGFEDAPKIIGWRRILARGFFFVQSVDFYQRACELRFFLGRVVVVLEALRFTSCNSFLLPEKLNDHLAYLDAFSIEPCSLMSSSASFKCVSCFQL